MCVCLSALYVGEWGDVVRARGGRERLVLEQQQDRDEKLHTYIRRNMAFLCGEGRGPGPVSNVRQGRSRGSSEQQQTPSLAADTVKDGQLSYLGVSQARHGASGRRRHRSHTHTPPQTHVCVQMSVLIPSRMILVSEPRSVEREEEEEEGVTDGKRRSCAGAGWTAGRQ